VRGVSALYRSEARAVYARFAGFGLSAAMLALTSLVATPSMVAASGPAAWGSIALGQAVGTVANVVVGWGWALSGPAAVARGDASLRRREYTDSIRVRLALLVPGSVLAAVMAAILTPHQVSFAVAGAISATLVALTSSWYFAGLSRPYVWLVLETLPRVCGTAVGIVLMRSGHSAIVGLVCMSSGMMLAFLCASAWIYRSTGRAGAERLPGDTLGEVLRSHRHGVASMAGSYLFLNTPMALVALIAPSVQPVYALADRVRQLISAGLNPLVLVFQGWVPRGGEDKLVRRSGLALGATCAVAVVFAALFLPIAPSLMRWLSDGQISVSELLIVLTALVIAVDLFWGVLENAVLAAFNRLDIVARASAVSFVAMLPAVAAGTAILGAAGAILGSFFGQMVRMTIDLVGGRRIVRDRYHGMSSVEGAGNVDA